MDSPADYRHWHRPDVPQAVMWEVSYHRPDLGDKITMAFPEQIERVVRALAGDLAADGGHILSISAIGADGERLTPI